MSGEGRLWREDAAGTPSHPPKRQKTTTQHDLLRASQTAPVPWHGPPAPRHDQYTVAWICALHIELAAARAVLDETYSDLPMQARDSNTYMLGSIKNHNVVIACLPAAQYGTNNAASVIAHLIRTFPSVRLALMVGIGGGVPGKVDIRLGDVVVGTSVVQHDLGKLVGNNQIQTTAVPRTLQPFLGTVVSSLRSKHELEPSQIPLTLRTKLFDYGRPTTPDSLFQATYEHESSTSSCDGCDQSKLVVRSKRVSDDPIIHYGTVASGNQVIRHGTTRDNIAQRLNVICFEMEAAGLMDVLPCLPIRGICDYSDSHKNKGWQKYAAATAAACARELLEALPVAQVHSQNAYASKPHQISQPRHFLVPFGRNREFVGRESILLHLLKSAPPSVDNDDCQRVAIEGLGGIGKTQIALEAVFRIRDEHPDCSVFWVPAIDATSFENAYREIGQQLQVHGIHEDGADVGSLVKTALSESDFSWLLIIDNADDSELLFGNTKPASLAKYLPFNRHGSIVFTTRNHEIVSRLDISPRNVLTINGMSRDESFEMLLGNADQNQATDVGNAIDLLEFLAYLPLAIKQASAYMAKTGIPIVRYLEHCRSSDKRWIRLLSKNFEDRRRYEESVNPVATTWLITFEHISRNNKLAAGYLQFMCILAEKGIPTSLLPPADEELEDDEMERDEAIGILKAYAFVSERSGGNLLDMHRLVRLAMRNWLESEKRLGQCATTVLRRLAAVFPVPVHENRAIWLKYLPHVQTALDLSNIVDDSETRSRLLFDTGTCLDHLGKYEEAEEMHRAALKLRQQGKGEEHVDTLISMNSLGNVLQRRGRYWEAEEMCQQTVKLRQKVLGQKHPDTLASVNSLANLLKNRRMYGEAEHLHRQTLELREEVLGTEHPGTLASMNNIALLLIRKGEFEEAERIFRRALNLMEKIHGKEHPDTLASMNNLAITLQNQGRFQEAEQMHQRTLELRQKVLGEEHPDTLISMNNLALPLSNRGKHTEAKQLYQRTLALRQRVLGKGHPDTLSSMKNLSRALERFSQLSITPSEDSGDGPQRSYNFQSSQTTPSSSTQLEPLQYEYSSENNHDHSHAGAPSALSNDFATHIQAANNPPAVPPRPGSPPSAPQQFNHDTPNGYPFKPPNRTGKRKALLIGINYFDQRCQLRDSINDARNMAQYVVEHIGYKREDMVILTDDQQNILIQPTKKNILRAMHWLAKDAQANDTLFFHYSGHSGDENDGEVIFPVDFRQVGHVTEDEMKRIMIRPLSAGVRLTAVFDSRNSAFSLDLPYIYSTQGILKESNLAAEISSIGLHKALSSFRKYDPHGVSSHILKFIRNVSKRGDSCKSTNMSPADILLWYSCKNDHTCNRPTITSQGTSTLSQAFMTALKKNNQLSYVQLLDNMHDELSIRCSQKPQLQCNHSLDLDSLFIM